MRLTLWLGVATMIVAAPPAFADILVWRDGSGISHYTNDIANVPAEYRKDAITVAKDWARSLPPPEPVPVQPVVAGPQTRPLDTVDAAVTRSGEDPVVVPAQISNVGSVVQNVQVAPGAQQDVVERLVPVPVIVDRGSRVSSRRPDDRRDERNGLPPASRAPYIQGAAGPPPISER